MQRPLQNVLIEAVIIGIMNAVLYYALKSLKIVVPTHVLLFICGALIHIILSTQVATNGGARRPIKQFQSDYVRQT